MLICSRPTQTRTVYRNGITFQIPLSNHSSCRFTVHPDGSGTGWDEAAPDVDQPHGLDYRSLQDLRKGFRKRLNKEHVACADATVGGNHIPGKVAVMDILDSTSDLTNYFDDGSYTGGGLVWCYSTGSAYGVLFTCATGDGTYGAVGDPTIIKLHPDKQWGGGDITWSGAHEFDASVDMTGPLSVKKDFTVDGTAVFTGVFLDGTTTFNKVAGESGPTFKILGDWSARANNTVYQARTDGEVHALTTTSNVQIQGLTDSANPPTVVRAWNVNPTGLSGAGITMLVKGGDYWKVTSATTVYWIPFGDNT